VHGACASNVVPAGSGGGHSDAGSAQDAAVTCQADAICQGLSGNVIPGRGAPCGGIAAMGCPSGDFVCLSIYPALTWDGPDGTCVPPTATTCTVAADCACLPGDCSHWGGSPEGPFRWACEGGRCNAHCN
jgi:hypothetical protein